MDDAKLRFGVGVLVLSAMGVGVILTFLFGAFPTVLARTYSLTVDMDSAAGVSPNTPVLRDGVRIGRVTKIELKPDGGVQLSLSIDADRQLTRNYLPRTISGSLITGDAKIEFRKDAAAARKNLEDVRAKEDQLKLPVGDRFDLSEETLAKTYYNDGDYILTASQPNEDPLEAIANLEDDVRRTLQKMEQAGAAIETAARSFNGVVSGNEGNIRDIAAKATRSLDQFEKTMMEIQTIMADPELRAGLMKTMETLPRVLDEAELMIASTKQTMMQFEKVGVAAENAVVSAGDTFQSLNRTVVNVEKFTEPLGERGGEIVEQVLVSLANLDNALLQINTLGEMVNNSDGSLRKLIQDDEIYFQVKRTLGNIENASVRIRPILDDVRIFTDKLARDPGELGVRGALNKRPSGMGLK
jgi:phospholipid/cholesterol/gamma-HCH transport system substrate-binding protein